MKTNRCGALYSPGHTPAASWPAAGADPRVVPRAQVRALISLSLRHPVRLAADPTAQAPRELTQEIIRLKGAAATQKDAVLLALCARSFASGRTIVFFATKAAAHAAKILFGLGGLPAAAELHGDMTQAARLESLERFRTVG